MYVMGPNADTWNFPYFGANFWEDWERPIHFEILEVDGTGYDADAGVKYLGVGAEHSLKNPYPYFQGAILA